ncbi:MAG: hypothetical protein HFJ50_07595 [Clostridia bacterium]|nr:hypothetical protein [Clostridia bacterium]
MPSVRNVFDLIPLDLKQWLIIASISIIPIIIMELQKKLNELVFGKPVYEYKEAREQNSIY